MDRRYGGCLLYCQKVFPDREKENNKQKKCKSYKIQKQATKYKNRLTVYFFIDKINYYSLQEADKKGTEVRIGFININNMM